MPDGVSGPFITLHVFIVIVIILYFHFVFIAVCFSNALLF